MKKTTLLCIFPPNRSPSSAIWEGVQSLAWENDQEMKILGTTFDVLDPKRSFQNVDGVISFNGASRLDEMMSEVGLPVINVSGNLPFSRFPRVRVDERESGRVAARHLVNAGYSTFVGLCHWAGTHFNQLRLEGFQEELERQGLGDVCHIVENGHEDLNAFLRELQWPCGMMVTRPQDAWRVLQSSWQLEVDVPNELGILCVDRSQNDAYWSPVQSLSCIQLPWQQVGAQAVEMMARWLREGEEPPDNTWVQGHEVIPQTSTHRSRQESPISVRVQAWLENEFDPSWGVQDLASKLGCSVSALYKNYRNAFGSGLKEELQSRRHQFCKDTLRNSHKSIEEISSLCGYTQASTFIQAFKKWEGLTPNQYRKQG